MNKRKRVNKHNLSKHKERNMVREKRKPKKSEENKKSNNKESKHKIKKIKFFFFGEVFFFLNRNNEIEAKETGYFSKTFEKRKVAKCF